MSVLDLHEDKWTPEPNSGCYLWHGAAASGGRYGTVKLPGTRRMGYVHRIVCAEVNGPPAEAAQASHLCHTPACVNPAHLIWESPKANIARQTIEKAGASGRAQAIKAGKVLRGGVSRRYKRWTAKVGRKYLGMFATEAEARAARDEELARRREGVS